MMWKVGFMLGCVFWSFHANAQVTPIEDAEGEVSIEVSGLGGHSGRCLRLLIRNLTSKKLRLKAAAGMVFRPDREDEQDLILAENLDSISLEPNGSFEKVTYAFCVKALFKSPSQNSKFRIADVTKKPLRELVAFIAKEGLQENTYAQQAVWALSDNLPVPGINFLDKNEGTQKLLKELCRIKKVPLPWYHIEYAPADTNAAFSDRIVRVDAEVSFHLPHNDVVTIVLLDQYKQTVKVFYENRPFHQGNHSYRFTLNANELRTNSYTLKVYSNSKLLVEKKMQLR